MRQRSIPRIITWWSKVARLHHRAVRCSPMVLDVRGRRWLRTLFALHDESLPTGSNAHRYCLPTVRT